MYIERECLLSKPFCSLQFDSSSDCIPASKTVSITMINNTAGFAGEHIYGGAFDNCYINYCNSIEVYHSLFTLIPNLNDSSPSAITSNPIRICYCFENEINCENETVVYSEAVFPGESLTLHGVIVGQFNGSIPGAVVVTSEYLNTTSPQSTGKECTPLHVTATANETMAYTNMKLQLLSYQMCSHLHPPSTTLCT